MLAVQEYLQSGKTLDDLSQEFGIKSTHHPDLPLVILNYDQINSSPKTHPIIRECRALVLEKPTFSVVAKSMNRFFNWGEVAEEMPYFDFSDFVVQSKEDGSLLLLYYYNGQWRANTRASFAQDNMQFQSFTWEEGVKTALGLNSLNDLDTYLSKGNTYVCELCTVWNKVVRLYNKPEVYLLTMFDINGKEYTVDQVDAVAGNLFSRPKMYQFGSMEEIQDFLSQQSETDPTFEGVVIRDNGNRRWKIKNPCYLALHRLRGESDNLFHPKNLLPFVLSGESDELLVYFPEVEQAFRECEKKVEEAFHELEQVWQSYHTIPVQKDFALAILGKTPFTSLLFQLRKEKGESQTLDDLKQIWRSSPQKILNFLLK